MPWARFSFPAGTATRAAAVGRRNEQLSPAEGGREAGWQTQGCGACGDTLLLLPLSHPALPRGHALEELTFPRLFAGPAGQAELVPSMLPPPLQLGDSFVHDVDAIAWLRLIELLCCAEEAGRRKSVVGPAGAEQDCSPPQRAGPPAAQAAPLALQQPLNPV